jgi:hypothetical protein
MVVAMASAAVEFVAVNADLLVSEVKVRGERLAVA